MNEQVKSRKRVSDHGEVFTSEREVNAMLDLVKQETERIDSRFLEPACGTGNFLAEVLRRKLAIVKARYSKSKLDYERFAFLALTSIYGVELLEDNVLECRNRMLEILIDEYKKILKVKPDNNYLLASKFILSRNILHGDALTMIEENGQAIIFSEWSFVSGDMVKRRDFRFDELLAGSQKQMSIFTIGWEYDENIEDYIPAPIKEYPLIDYRGVQYA